MSKGKSQRRIDSRRRGLERHNSRGKTNNVDIDSDELPNFIIIDPPAPSQCSSSDIGTSQKDNHTNIICIDDDDDSESGDYSSHQNSFEEGGNRGHCINLSNKCHPTTEQSQKSHLASDMPNKSSTLDHQGKKSSSQSSSFHKSNCCFRKVSSHNQHDFGCGTSCEYYDSDSDIEEDYLGNIRQQWEKASLKKKRFQNVPKGHSGIQGEVNAMGSKSNFKFDLNKMAEVPIPSSTSDTNHENSNLSSSTIHRKGTISGTFDKLSKDNLNVVLQENIEQEMLYKTHLSDRQVTIEMAFESVSNSQAHIQLNHHTVVTNGNGQPDVQSCIIGDREKLKKTDAYKRVEEEEWACRQRELRIQAEEAQRLRKRKKAEALRLLEIERRQKQRVEEVREAQKKDEEMLNLKEQIRVRIRREIDDLEANSPDMASLLRGLGILVRGDLSPSSSEVHAAYKQALFRFHPDRASRGDIQQQIEAEEKFKLISRAKERFMV